MQVKHLLVSPYGLRFVGLDGGVVGNHAQRVFETVDGQLLLAPTIGLVARVTFNDLMSGKAIAPDLVRIFFHQVDQELKAFANRVADALITGKYRPSDLLYYFPDVSEYMMFSHETASLWESDPARLLRRLPTPGAMALKKQLLVR